MPVFPYFFIILSDCEFLKEGWTDGISMTIIGEPSSAAGFNHKIYEPFLNSYKAFREGS